MLRIGVFAASLVIAAAPALAQSKAQIQKLDDAFAAAFNKGDAKAVAAMYAPDAYILPPGAAMLKGRPAIAGFWAEAVKQMSDVKCSAIEVKPLGPRAAREIGTCTFKTKAHPPQDEKIKYAVAWEKTRGGWKLLQDIWNADK